MGINNTIDIYNGMSILCEISDFIKVDLYQLLINKILT